MQDPYHNISEIKIDDNHIHLTNWLGRCCGLFGLGNFQWIYKQNTKEEWKKWYKNTLRKKCIDYDTENFHFVLTEKQIVAARAEKGNETTTLLGWFVNLPGFKEVYRYKQNAHGSNIICICMYHGRPNEVKL